MDRLKRWARLLQPRRLLGRWTGPRVLVVSVPKAGTNLLRHVLCMFPQLSGAENVVPLSVEEQLQRVAALRPGRIISSHLAWQPELGILLTEQELRGVYISRDPRDVCVSYCHYVMQETRHPWHSYFRKLPDDGTRLMIAITGVDEHPSGERRWFLPSIDAVFRCRLPFGTHPRFCAVAFEELIGSAGGGSDVKQRAAIRRIANHLGLRLTTRDMDRIASRAFSADSPTFRRGRIGSWCYEMTDARRLAFKEIAGQLLVELGYEEGFDW